MYQGAGKRPAAHEKRGQEQLNKPAVPARLVNKPVKQA